MPCSASFSQMRVRMTRSLFGTCCLASAMPIAPASTIASPRALHHQQA